MRMVIVLSDCKLGLFLTSFNSPPMFVVFRGFRIIVGSLCVCVCVCVCVCERERERVRERENARAYVHTCLRTCVHELEVAGIHVTFLCTRCFSGFHDTFALSLFVTSARPPPSPARPPRPPELLE